MPNSTFGGIGLGISKSVLFRWKHALSHKQLAMIKAIVAHPIACEGIRVADNIDVMFAEAEGEYVDHIEALLGEADWREALGVAAPRLVEELYACPSIGRRMSELYEACLERYMSGKH